MLKKFSIKYANNFYFYAIKNIFEKMNYFLFYYFKFVNDIINYYNKKINY